MKKTIIFLSIALFAIAACQSQEVDWSKYQIEPVLGVENASVSFEAKGGDGVVKVTEEGTITATSGKDWLQTSVSGNTVNLKASPNPSIDSRYAQITIKSSNGHSIDINVTQFGVIVSQFTGKDINTKNAANAFTFAYKANMPMTTTTNADWISVETGNEEFTVKVTENTSKLLRKGTVTCNFGTYSKEINISQFDAAEVGILGNWSWTSKMYANGRFRTNFNMDASIEESGDSYVLNLSNSVGIELKTPVLIDGETIKFPLGENIGKYNFGTTTYNAGYALISPVTAASVAYANCTNSGYLSFTLEKNESTGIWSATPDMTPYDGQYLRFSFWEDSTHSGLCKSAVVMNAVSLKQKN